MLPENENDGLDDVITYTHEHMIILSVWLAVPTLLLLECGLRSKVQDLLSRHT